MSSLPTASLSPSDHREAVKRAIRELGTDPVLDAIIEVMQERRAKWISKGYDSTHFHRIMEALIRAQGTINSLPEGGFDPRGAPPE